ncbi:MAG: hypothetical protein ABIY47_16730 [Opitutaceae bacterium]
MRWRKLGLLFSPAAHYPWMVSHAANPTAEVLPSGRVRIWFSTRDAKNRSHITAGIFELQPSPRLLDLAPEPLVSPGTLGAFDDSGVSMACLVSEGEALRLYYLGWNLGVTVPWRNSIGLAISHDRGTSFTKHSVAPVMDRHDVDPFSLSYPWVLRDGERWRMWYGSNLRWGATERDMDHVVKYAESPDGINWQRNGQAILPHAGPLEYAHARPCVIRDPDRFRMWFTHRGSSYRLGYAESTDGFVWTRVDALSVLEISPPGTWDSDMITYPCVFDCMGARYLLYNGNAYGRTGFGLALLE